MVARSAVAEALAAFFSAPTNGPSIDSATAVRSAELCSPGEKAIRNSGKATSCAFLLLASPTKAQARARFSFLSVEDFIWATATLLICASQGWHNYFSQAIQVSSSRQS